MLISTLNVHGSNSPFKRHREAEEGKSNQPQLKYNPGNESAFPTHG